MTKTPLTTAKQVTNAIKQKNTAESTSGDKQITSALEQLEKSFALQSEQNTQGESKHTESNKNCKRVIQLTL